MEYLIITQIEEKIFNVYRDTSNRSLYNFDELRKLNLANSDDPGSQQVAPNVFDIESLNKMEKIKNKFFKS